MKKLMLAAAILFAACSTKTNDVSQEENDASQPTFNEGNIPAEGIDVGQWSGGIQHIGLPTTDVQKTIDFYSGLGFKTAGRFTPNGRDFAFVQLGSLLIEIIPTAEPAMCNGAVDHFCLDVKDIETVYRRLSEAGYHMLSDGIQDIDFWEHGARYFFIRGPNNEKIEFCEVL